MQALRQEGICMSDFVQDVINFRNKYGLPINYKPTFLDKDHMFFRLNHIQEEFNELSKAVKDKDMVEIADALTDLCYVSIGTALSMGINIKATWEEVHYSNMQKVRAKSDGSNSKRKSSFDIVKPEGWVPPNIHRALKSPWVINNNDPILLRAHNIIDNRSEEKEREYGSLTENCEHAAQIASIMQRKDFLKSDVIAVLISLKLARPNRSYKQDSLLDAAAYIGGLDNMYQEEGDDRVSRNW